MSDNLFSDIAAGGVFFFFFFFVLPLRKIIVLRLFSILGGL